MMLQQNVICFIEAKLQEFVKIIPFIVPPHIARINSLFSLGVKENFLALEFFNLS